MRITVEQLTEAARHVYGGVCGREGCVWCEELPALRRLEAAEEHRFRQTMRALLPSPKDTP
jgi:hypothetical protein